MRLFRSCLWPISCCSSSCINCRSHSSLSSRGMPWLISKAFDPAWCALGARQAKYATCQEQRSSTRKRRKFIEGKEIEFVCSNEDRMILLWISYMIFAAWCKTYIRPTTLLPVATRYMPTKRLHTKVFWPSITRWLACKANLLMSEVQSKVEANSLLDKSKAEKLECSK